MAGSFVSGGFLAAVQKYWQAQLGQRKRESEKLVARLEKIKVNTSRPSKNLGPKGCQRGSNRQIHQSARIGVRGGGGELLVQP